MKGHPARAGPSRATVSSVKAVLLGMVMGGVLVAIVSSSNRMPSSSGTNDGFKPVRVDDKEDVDVRVLEAEAAAGINEGYPVYNTGASSAGGTAVTDDGDIVDESDEIELDEDTIRKQRFPRGAAVDALGGLFFSDGLDYLSAPTIKVPPPMRSYKKAWRLLEMHEKLFRSMPHKAYIPRLAQDISRAQFNEIFRKTSTPVIIPFEHLRHLGFKTQKYTLDELASIYPYYPGKKVKTTYSAKDGMKGKIDLGPAVYALQNDHGLKKKGYKRNFPRNIMLGSKIQKQLGISLAPFADRKAYQLPTLWFGTSTSDTKFHHDCCDNWVTMITGIKRWIIAPPSDWQHLMPIKCILEHQSLCWASVEYPNKDDLTSAERAKLQKLAKTVVDLAAGEVLFLPAGWFHHIENLGPTVMVNLWSMGCQNSAVAMYTDPARVDRSDFTKCPATIDKFEKWLRDVSRN